MIERKILYVDDERANRVVFEQAYRTKFQITSVASAELALELLKTAEFNVIVTDQRMPGMSGHELLEKTRVLYPNLVRIVITAYNDIDPILRAVNDGLVSRYVVKPWDRAELEQILTWAIEHSATTRHAATLQTQLLQAERNATLSCVATILRGHLLPKELSPVALASLASLLESDGGAEEARVATCLPIMQQAAKSVSQSKSLITCVAPADLLDAALAPGELMLVLVNLIDNAIHASRPGAQITVEASLRGGNVELVVADQGAGMTPDVLARAGTPFFSTRPHHHGLGLAQCRLVLERAGGALKLECPPGGGTRAMFAIPVAAAPSV